MASARRRAAGVWTGIGLAVWAMATPLSAQAGAADVFYERAVMVAAGRKCALFSAPVAAALVAGRAQARGMALRGGVDAAALAEVEARAIAKVAAADCASSDVATAAGRVRNAFEGWSRLLKMNYPGESATWRADRSKSPTVATWRLAQDSQAGADRMTFGLAGKGDPSALLAVASFADGARPYAAQFVLRDTNRTTGPYLPAGQAAPLDQRIAPRNADLIFSAEAKSVAGTDLMGKDAKPGVAFRFPAAAAGALARLDPREAVAVDFLFTGPNGDSVRTLYVEVGDFAAGAAFLAGSTRS